LGVCFDLRIKIAIIGGGPAGLRAAEVAAEGGAAVTLFDAKPSVGRKFLVAGRGGLNLTHSEPHSAFVTRYSGPEVPANFWESVLTDFDSEALREWAAGLGVETFIGTSGRVFPRELKAAPLLRRWVERLRKQGVHFSLRHRLTTLRKAQHWTLVFQAQDEQRTYEADAVILALGGGSWPDTGSDGKWVTLLEQLGVAVSPLAPANCGWELPWPTPLLAEAEGLPIKNIVAHVGEQKAVGELVITKYGLEGNILYQLGSALRATTNPEILLDFKPSFTVAQLVAKLGTAQRNFLAEAQSRWRLSDSAMAILKHLPEKPFTSALELASTVKRFPLRLTGPRPIAEAISSAGGVRWSEIDSDLMLKRFPGLYVAGEMIDWEAPTGGYLMQGCFATGTRAAKSALDLARGPL
jgi:uncharacterized flavoprotein (TIGR03862 family)